MLSEKVEESESSIDASLFSIESQGLSVDEEPQLPILKKLSDLSDKIQVNLMGLLLLSL